MAASAVVESSADPHPYGVCPTQLQGIAGDGRPFYFRARGGGWRLWAGPRGADPDYLDWCEQEELIAEGSDETCGFLSSADVDAIVTDHLGSRWVSTIAATRGGSSRGIF